MSPTTGFDNTPYFNLALAYCIANGTALVLGKGSYSFLTRPNTITDSFMMIGHGIRNTYIYQGYNEASPTRGFMHITNGSVNFRDFSINRFVGATGGAGLAIVPASVADNPSFSYFSGLYISGASTWTYAVYIDGTALPSFGVRDVSFNNCNLFASSIDIVHVKCGVHIAFSNGGAYQAGGTASTVKFTGVSGTDYSSDCSFSGYCGGTLVLDYVQDITATIRTPACSVTNTANTYRAQIFLTSSTIGTIQTNWNDSFACSTAATYSQGSLHLLGSLGFLTIWGTSTSPSSSAGSLSYTHSSGSFTFNALKTGGSASMVFNTSILGAFATRMTIAAGVTLGSPTGGDLGAGYLNVAGGYSINNNAVYYATGTDVTVSDGGSGRSTATAYAPLLGGTTSTGAHQSMASGSAGQLCASQGAAAVPIWSTPTYPLSSGTSRKKLVSDGTNIVYSTETWAVPGSAGNVLRSDGTNWIAGQAVLTTDVTGVLPPANGGSMTMSVASGTTQAASVNNGYICTNASQCNVTLPATAAVGDRIKVVSQGAAGIKVTANTSQTIKGLSQTTTSAGSVTPASQYDTIQVVCVVANTTWVIDTFTSSLLTFA